MQQDNNSSDNAILYVVLSIIFFVLAVYIFNKYGHIVKSQLICVVLLELRLPSIFSKEAAYVMATIQKVGDDNFTFSQVVSQLHYAGKWYAWLISPVYCYICFVSWNMSVSDKYTRRLNMKTLLSNNVSKNPCVAPIVNWPRSILEENPDDGPWATAWQPIRFVAEHGILIYRETGLPVPRGLLLDALNTANLGSNLLKQKQSTVIFDRKQAQAVFSAQLGHRYYGISRLPAYLRKLGTAFYLFGSDKKVQGQALMDEMSLSFRAPVQPSARAWTWKPPFYSAPQAGHGYLLDCALPEHFEDCFAKMESIVAPHDKYCQLAILSLYEFARRKGVLPTSEFIWLRPIDRRMFYLCNNVGRRTAWPEIAGAWAHYKVESALIRFEEQPRGVEDPQCLEAVNALEMAMYDEGWTDQLSEPAKRGMLEG